MVQKSLAARMWSKLSIAIVLVVTKKNTECRVQGRVGVGILSEGECCGAQFMKSVRPQSGSAAQGIVTPAYLSVTENYAIGKYAYFVLSITCSPVTNYAFGKYIQVFVLVLTEGGHMTTKINACGDAYRELPRRLSSDMLFGPLKSCPSQES